MRASGGVSRQVGAVAPVTSAGPSFRIEGELHRRGVDLVLGVDEVGRGALAGPLVASVCALGEGSIPEGIDDSKRLSPWRRRELCEAIKQSAVTWGTGEVQAPEIDRLGVAGALRLAAHRAAVEALGRLGVDGTPRIHFLVDGPVSFVEGRPATPITRGDSISVSIAAASIIAKVHRDAFMIELAERYPEYGFDSHKGYGTAAHLKALLRHGPSPVHRRSFGPVRDAASGRVELQVVDTDGIGG